MAVGPILTLGLGAFTGGGVRFLPTLGYGTSGTPPTPSTGIAGGAGRPVYRVRKWRETREVLEEGFQSVFEELQTAGLPKDVMGEVVAAVKIHADKKGRYRSIPRLNEVDWKGLEADAKTARRLVDIYERHVARLAFEQMMEEEDDEILLLH